MLNLMLKALYFLQYSSEHKASIFSHKQLCVWNTRIKEAQRRNYGFSRHRGPLDVLEAPVGEMPDDGLGGIDKRVLHCLFIVTGNGELEHH